MAERLLRHDAGDRFEVFSAGTKPSHVRPEAIMAMRELGIDISGQRSKSIDEFTGQPFDYVLPDRAGTGPGSSAVAADLQSNACHRYKHIVWSCLQSQVDCSFFKK